jgi:hypothetical protein
LWSTLGEILVQFFGRTLWQWLASTLIGAGMILILGNKAWPAEALVVGYTLLLPGMVLALATSKKELFLGPIWGLAVFVVMLPFLAVVGGLALVEKWNSLRRPRCR